MKRIFVALFTIASLVACQKNDTNDFLGESVTQRIENQKQELLQELTSAEQGWKLAYQPNSKKYGGFTFLMKFDKNGNVVMTSDAPGGSVQQESGLYQIVTRQTTTLSFLTKNHIHRLADAEVETGTRGVGYEGEFDFLYFGKENGKLKFRTQRHEGEFYFEKATERDWATIQFLSPLVTDVAADSYRHFLRVTAADGTITDYKMAINQQRMVTIKNFTDKTDKKSFGITPTAQGFTLAPAVEFHGKKFSELPWDREVNRYIAQQDGVKVEIIFALKKREEHITDDATDILKLDSFVFLTNYLLNTPYTSATFKEAIYINDQFGFFPHIRINFMHETKECEVAVVYNFNGTNASMRMLFSYELKNKRLYLTKAKKGFEGIGFRSPHLWVLPRNRAVRDKAIVFFTAFAQDDETKTFFIEKQDERFDIPFDIYTLQFEGATSMYMPFFAVPL